MMRIVLLALTNFAVMGVLFVSMNIIGKLFGINMSTGRMGGHFWFWWFLYQLVDVQVDG